MTPTETLRRLEEIEKLVRQGQFTLLSAIDELKRRHREMMAGNPRSYELEDALRELRQLRAALAAQAETPRTQ